MAPELIVALDVPSKKEARRVVDMLGGVVRFFKVGLELFTAEGPDLVRDLTSGDRKIFLDLKLHDIPNTVAGAVRSAAGLGVSLLTLHTLGGEEMMRAAVEAALAEGDRLRTPPPRLLGVTVLTSQRGGPLFEEAGLASTVLALASGARKAGLPGVVASVEECAAIKETCGKEFLVTTPGIRPAGGTADDQKRVATPAGAVSAGSDFLVVGRPILKARDPARAAAAILMEMQAAVKP